MQELQPGLVIGGYRLLEEVAKGGMGTIFRAIHVEMKGEVAVKVLKKDLASQPEIIKRFLREGKLISRLDHPGIVKVFDLGRQGDLYYLIMEFIDGRNLQQIIDDDGPFPVARALRLVRDVADALAHAHEMGIVHRDVKPSNLILSKSGRVFITDFGIARLLEQETALTKAGVLIGTPTHMAPEQCRGNLVDGRCDIYSLGATFYTLLSGKPPFSSKSPARLISQLLNESPAPIESVVPDLSSEVAAFIKRLMAKHPAARPQTAREVADTAAGLLSNGQDTPAPLARPRAGSARDVREPQSSVGFLATVMVAVVCIGGLTFLLDGDSAGARRAVDDDGAIIRVGAGSPAGGSKTKTAAGKSGSRDTAESAAADIAAAQALLEQRISQFSAALLAARVDEALQHVDPTLRSNPSLLISFGRIVESVRTLGPETKVEHTFTMDDRKADVIFLFRNDRVGTGLRVPVSWQRRGENWYLHPQSDVDRVK